MNSLPESAVQEQLYAIEAERRSLQLLVSELLLTNHQLRAEVELLKRRHVSTAKAIHPPQPQDH